MGATRIEWATHTWQVTAGCEHAGRGCAHCYAERMAVRQAGIAAAARAAGRDPGRSADYEGAVRDGRWSGTVRTLPHRLADPLGWRKPRVVFVDSMADLFHPDVPDHFVGAVFDVMARAHWHVFIVLTKRPERAGEWLRAAEFEDGAIFRISEPVKVNGVKMGTAAVIRPRDGGRPWPLPNVILGTSIANQADADARLPHLARCPAACRMVSYEPACGPVNRLPLNGIGWLVMGAESGQGAAPMPLDWARDVCDRCEFVGVPFFLKQADLGAGLVKMPALDGCVHESVPDVISRLSVTATRARGANEEGR